MDALIKDKQSKLDPFEDSLLDMDAGKFALAEIQQSLSRLGVTISIQGGLQVRSKNPRPAAICPTISIRTCLANRNRAAARDFGCAPIGSSITLAIAARVQFFRQTLRRFRQFNGFQALSSTFNHRLGKYFIGQKSHGN